MNIFEEKAAQIYSDMNGGTVAMDPFLIGAIVDLLFETIELFKGCGRSEETVLVAMQDPNFIQRWRFRRLVRKHNLPRTIIPSSQKVAKTFTINEVKEMYASV